MYQAWPSVCTLCYQAHPSSNTPYFIYHPAVSKDEGLDLLVSCLTASGIKLANAKPFISSGEPEASTLCKMYCLPGNPLQNLVHIQYGLPIELKSGYQFFGLLLMYSAVAYHWLLLLRLLLHWPLWVQFCLRKINSQKKLVISLWQRNLKAF